MTRTLAIVIFTLTISTGFLVGRNKSSVVPTVEEIACRVSKTSIGRTAMTLFWIWIGWHFFAR